MLIGGLLKLFLVLLGHFPDFLGHDKGANPDKLSSV